MLLDILAEGVLGVQIQDECPSQYVKTLRKFMWAGYEFARGELSCAGEKQQCHYTTHSDSCFQPGDFVLYHYKPAAAKKIGKPWNLGW